MIRGLFLYLAVKVFPALSMIMYMIIMYMSYSPIDYVAYSAAIAAGMIGAQLATSWISSAIIFHFPLRKGKADFVLQVLRIAVISVLLSSIVTSVVFYIIFHDFELSCCVLFLTAMQGMFYVAAALFQPERRMRAQVVSALMLCITQICFASYVVLNHASTLQLSVAGYGAGFLAGLTTLILYIRWTWFNSVLRKRQKRLSTNEDPLKNASFLAYGGPMFLWFSLMLVSSYTDRFFLAGMEGPGVAGYAFTKDLLIGVSGFISMPIMLIAHSMIFRFFREGKTQELSRLMRFSTTLLVVLFIFAVFLYVFFAKVQLAYFSPDLQGISFFQAVFIGLGIMFNLLSLYSQKKFEVLGRLKHIVILAAISNAAALLAYVYSSYKGSLDFFAISYMVSTLLYFFMTIWTGPKIIGLAINYRVIFSVLLVLVVMCFFSPPAIYNGYVDWGALGWAIVWLTTLAVILIFCVLRIYHALGIDVARS